MFGSRLEYRESKMKIFSVICGLKLLLPAFAREPRHFLVGPSAARWSRNPVAWPSLAGAAAAAGGPEAAAAWRAGSPPAAIGPERRAWRGADRCAFDPGGEREVGGSLEIGCANFGRTVLDCIKANFWNYRLILQYFSTSRRLTCSKFAAVL